MATGSYCGPTPEPGNGLGPDGVCTGNESGPPCGTGVTVGTYYAYTVPGACQARIVFDGRDWWSELPDPGRPLYVWMSVATDGTVSFIAPTGSVEFDATEQHPAQACG